MSDFFERPTSNDEIASPVYKLAEYLRNPKDMVDTLLDRLYHRCVVIKIDGDSLHVGSSE